MRRQEKALERQEAEKGIKVDRVNRIREGQFRKE